MSERDAILSAILADPADDVSRLVYADWLEETGRSVAAARARFIRLQIELARGVPAQHFPERTAEITEELTALAAQWARAWLTELPAPVAKSIWKQHLGAGAFRRGFVDGVTLETDTFIETAPALFAATPLTELHLHGGENHTKTALTSPHLKRLRAVRLSGSWDGNRIARHLGRCPDLGAVRTLDLSNCRLRNVGAFDLVRAPALTNLSVLRLQWNRLSELGVSALALAPEIAAITTLDVIGNPGVRSWKVYLPPRCAEYSKRLVF